MLARGERLDLLHRRHGLDARRQGLRRLRQRQVRACARWPSRMARELGPKNIHVAHLVIDSGVDTAFVRERIAAAQGQEAAGEHRRPAADGAVLDRRGLLDACTSRARDGWTHELDLRPYAETW